MKARDADEKAAVALESLAENIQKELETMQTRLFEKANAFRAEHSHTHINSMDHSKQHLAESKQNDQIPGWVLAGWCGDDACEQA